MAPGSRTYLVEESTSLFEVVHISGVSFASPEFHIRDLHIAPIYKVSLTGERSHQAEFTHSDNRYTSYPHRLK